VDRLFEDIREPSEDRDMKMLFGFILVLGTIALPRRIHADEGNWTQCFNSVDDTCLSYNPGQYSACVDYAMAVCDSLYPEG
jgi:hypothetical protein